MTISVALCTFNGAQFLNAQLQSLAAQSQLPHEVVACDDGSSDETLTILHEFARTAPFPVRVLQNAENLGVVRNFERAMNECSGDVIALCDQDDIWLPAKLARIRDAFARDAQLALWFSNANVINERGDEIGAQMWESVGFFGERQEMFVRGGGFAVLLRRNAVTGAAGAFRRCFRDLVLPIPPRLATEKLMLHDAWIALCLSAVAPACACSEPLLQYREHAAQQVGFRATTTNRERYFMAREVAFSLLRERLQEAKNYNTARVANALTLLNAEIAHLAMRRGLSCARSRRLAPVARELLRGGYHRHAGGWRSALSDLMRRIEPTNPK